MQIKMAEEEIQGNQSSNVIEEQSSACPGTVAENASGESLAFTAGTSEMYSNIRSEKPHVADSEQKWECMSSTPVALAPFRLRYHAKVKLGPMFPLTRNVYKDIVIHQHLADTRMHRRLADVLELCWKHPDLQEWPCKVTGVSIYAQLRTNVREY
eukprot:gb/GECG01003050.1/.p1 GENE.gb/GECG01003050.1/~~gb/GECG01003050.1/.p1  ORF type:complete len:155 (+),score=16.40 gb/GECG01003050.1/:1-465(+)